MTKQLFINVTLFCIIAVCSFWMGTYSKEKIIRHLQSDLIQAQKAHKESLRKEAEYLERLNGAFDKAYEIERPVTVMLPPDPKPLEITAGIKE